MIQPMSDTIRSNGIIFIENHLSNDILTMCIDEVCDEKQYEALSIETCSISQTNTLISLELQFAGAYSNIDEAICH